jgi:hypothetical protein
MIIAGAFLTGQAPRIADGMFTVETGVLNFVRLRVPAAQRNGSARHLCNLHLVTLMRAEPIADKDKALDLEVAVQGPEGNPVDVFVAGGDGTPLKSLKAVFVAGELENELRWIQVVLDVRTPGRHVFNATLTGGSTASVAVDFRFTE